MAGQACGMTVYWFRSDAPELIGVATGGFAGEALAEPRFSAAHGQQESWIAALTGWKQLP